MNLQKVYEKEDYGMGYGHVKVGLRVDDRVIWFGYTDSLTNEGEFKRLESLVDEIVNKCGR